MADAAVIGHAQACIENRVEVFLGRAWPGEVFGEHGAACQQQFDDGVGHVEYRLWIDGADLNRFRALRQHKPDTAERCRRCQQQPQRDGFAE